MENQYMPKQYIEFKCRHQRIERTDDFFVVGGSQRYLYAKFDFCSDWSELQQYAVFTGDLQTYRIPIVDGECEVPWEMLLTKRFFVGCEAGQRITSNAVEIKVHPCGAPEETGAPRKPTPTLQSQIGNLSDLQTEAKENLVDAINEVYGQQKEPEDVPGLPGEDGGYYIPTVSQVDENTVNVYFVASKEGMQAVPDREVTLPSGKPGDAGITPHIGDNGNWFIGDTDTGMPSRGQDAPKEAVLYTPQDLTPEQQAQARQNIGIDELPTGGDNNYRLITKIVFDETNQSSVLEISKDMDGNDIALTKVLIYADFKAHESSRADGHLNLNYPGFNNILSVEKTAYRHIVQAEMIDGICYLASDSNITGTSSPSGSRTAYIRDMEEPKITWIRWYTGLQGGVSPPTGSTLTVYGY